jgi:hypothetical protein
MTLADYYFCHPELFVVPIEHLSPQGMTASFADVLCARVALPDGWVDLFNAAYATYWERAARLAQRSPQYWFPPRLQHCCIVTDAARVRPYFQPFNKCSWLLYAGDFDPTISNREFAAYQFFHAERMGLLQEVTQTVVRNLAYWLVRSDDEIDAFCTACRRTLRPDAAAFGALADAMAWIRRLSDEALRPPRVVVPRPGLRVPHTGVLIRPADQPKLDALVQSWRTAAQAAMQSFYAIAIRGRRDRAGELSDWLRQTRPQVVITGERARCLWDPSAPDRVGPVRTVLRGLSDGAAESIRADVQVIDTHTRAFLGSLRNPDDLPRPHSGMAQSGLSYLDATRRLVAYNLQETGMDRLRVPAPPYERFMLAARTIHEWGHLAVDAGWIPLAADRLGDYQRLGEELACVFEEIYRSAPAAARAHTAEDMTRLIRDIGAASASGGNSESARLRGMNSPAESVKSPLKGTPNPRSLTDGRSVGEALARFSLARMADYQANLLARCYLSVEEMETYIRNNVYTLALEYSSTALFRRLARYAYEAQYLRLSRIADPRTYFANSTWFTDEYLQRGIVSAPLWERLVVTLGNICGCYVVDWTQFTPGFAAARNDSGGTG